MTLHQKIYSHQVQPAKLVTDILSTFVALVLLWQGNILVGVLIGFFPTVIISLLLMSKDSSSIVPPDIFKEIKKYMSSEVQYLRFVGFLLLCVGAFSQEVSMIGAGLLLLTPAWVWGLSLFLKERIK